MMETLGLLDLPSLVHLKIVSFLDPHSIVQLAQACQKLREVVKLDYLTQLVLPNDLLPCNNNRRKIKALRFKLNIDACSKPFYWRQKNIYYDGLDLAALMETLKIVEFADIAEIYINLNYGFPSFAEQQQEDHIFLQEMVKKMKRLKRFKLAVNCRFIDSVITHIHYKHITDLMKFSCAKEVILKLPAFAKQRFGTLFIPRTAKKVVVIGPCFGYSGKRMFANKDDKDIILKFMNGICVYRFK